MSLFLILHANKSFVWARRRSHLTASCLSTVSLLLELLFVKLGYFSVRVCLRTKLVVPFTFYVTIDFIFYLIVLFSCVNHSTLCRPTIYIIIIIIIERLAVSLRELSFLVSSVSHV